jgi:tetratricopeptide (TPR) repeat protein
VLNKCLEPLTAIGCALGACVIGLLDPGVAVGAIIGGAGLLARFRETSEKHGLDSEALIGKMRLAVIRAWDKADQTEAERDAMGAADAAMETYLADCMPTREELAATARRGANVYPAEAAALVVDRLAAHNDQCRALFAAPSEHAEPSIARRFALTAVETAMRAATDDPAYAPLLTLDLVIEVAGAVGRIERGQGEDRARDETFQAEVLEWVRAQRKGEGLSDEALRGAIARFIAFRPDARPEEVLDAIETFERDYRALLKRVSRIEAVDNLVASFKAAAEAALRDGDIETARAHYAEAIAAATERAAEPARNAAALIDADATAALVALDWHAADAAWARAEAILAPFDADAEARLAWEAAHRLQDFGDTFGIAGALDAAIRRLREFRARPVVAGDPHIQAGLTNNLGNVLGKQGERTSGEAGLALLAEAVAAYRTALTIYTEAAMPIEWAMTQNNLGNVLGTQGERTGGEAGLALLGEAVAAYRAALRVYTEPAMPAEWAMTQNNLGNVLGTQGERMGGEAGLALLAEAVAAYRAALVVRTEAAMPAHWATTQSNLGTALRTQGERTSGMAGLALLAEAVAAYRATLKVRTEAVMPAQWANTQNNLGSALGTQAARTIGEEGLALLAEAAAAYRAALTVYTEAAMPNQWSMTQNNLGNVYGLQGERTPGETGLGLLAKSVAAYRAAMQVYTEVAMPVDWAMTQNNLGIVLRTQAERVGGEAGLALLAEAVAAYRAALRVYTETAMPADWAMTQNNLGTALEARGERTGGEAGLAPLVDAAAAYREALRVYTAEHFGHQHMIVMRNSARVAALIERRLA